jgi:nucleotide-binding universal stress UspA family protein
MFEQILVPLDGSKLAEAAIPAAVYLSKIFLSSVSLVHVIESNAPELVHGERHLGSRDEAVAYLQTIANTMFPSDVWVETHVHEEKVEDVAQAIFSHVNEFESDLAVMCTHGHGGLREVLYGSIAQQVVRQGTTPVLLIRPDNNKEGVFQFRKIMVPLDGDPEHEQGLPIAAGVALGCEAGLHLLAVVHTVRTLPGDQALTGRLLPGATSAFLDLLAVQSKENLKEKVKGFQELGIKTTIEVKRGDPVHSIIKSALCENVDLIVMSTHGKAGTNAFWEGSVAPRVSGRTHLPLLLVPSTTAQPEGG